MQNRSNKERVADKKVKEANLYLEKLNERVSLKSKSLFSGNEMITFQSQIKNAKDSKNKTDKRSLQTLFNGVSQKKSISAKRS